MTGKSISTQGQSATVRTDIQALRAVAVSLVLVFHLWPGRLSGGFVGVDVFFVISGFLITSHLLAHPPAGVGDLLGFWARRLQRLLPASLLVLVVSLIGTRLYAPESVWGSTAAEIKAATLYYVNWDLASNSVDYLAAEAAPSPIQHYWSLSIEEQFYLGWPVLLLALFLLARASGRSAKQVVVPGIVAVVVASLGYSVYRTAAEPAAAYFVTPTRIWELAAGGLLAALLSRRAFGRDVDHEHVQLSVPTRIAVAWLGLAAMVWSAMAYSGATPFPGWQALVPVLSTVAVIAVDAPRTRWSPAGLMAWSPIQFLGGISYSVYLWHWPMVVLQPYATGRPLSGTDKFLILGATMVLATVTKIFIEDRFRQARFRAPLYKPFVATAVAMALVFGLGQSLTNYFEDQQQRAEQELAAALKKNAKGDRKDSCFGADALGNPQADCERTTSSPVVPAPNLAIDDKSDAYDDNCWEWIPFDEARTCSYGKKKSEVDIALVGNSHAGQWLPALQRLAKAHSWHITTFLASECTATKTLTDFDTDEASQGCLDWGERVLDEIAGGDFDLVLTSERTGRVARDAGGGDSQPFWEAGYREWLGELADSGQRTVVLHDTPFPASTDVNGPTCISENEDDLTACSAARDEWVPDDPLVNAAEDLANEAVSVIDLTDFICGPEVCDVAVGGVTVYFDCSHISATYSATLAPYLGKELVPIVKRASS